MTRCSGVRPERSDLTMGQEAGEVIVDIGEHPMTIRRKLDSEVLLTAYTTAANLSIAGRLAMFHPGSWSHLVMLPPNMCQTLLNVSPPQYLP